MAHDEGKIKSLAIAIGELTEGHTVSERVVALSMVLSKTIQISAKSHEAAVRLAGVVSESIATDLQEGKQQ